MELCLLFCVCRLYDSDITGVCHLTGILSAAFGESPERRPERILMLGERWTESKWGCIPSSFWSCELGLGLWTSTTKVGTWSVCPHTFQNTHPSGYLLHFVRDIGQLFYRRGLLGMQVHTALCYVLIASTKKQPPRITRFQTNKPCD